MKLVRWQKSSATLPLARKVTDDRENVKEDVHKVIISLLGPASRAIQLWKNSDTGSATRQILVELIQALTTRYVLALVSSSTVLMCVRRPPCHCLATYSTLRPKLSSQARA